MLITVFATVKTPDIISSIKAIFLNNTSFSFFAFFIPIKTPNSIAGMKYNVFSKIIMLNNPFDKYVPIAIRLRIIK